LRFNDQSFITIHMKSIISCPLSHLLSSVLSDFSLKAPRSNAQSRITRRDSDQGDALEQSISIGDATCATQV
jgi:hypothetical protein